MTKTSVSLPIEERGYTTPEILVSTDWVADRLGDPSLRIVEVDEDARVYTSGHVPGAVQIDWTRDLSDPIRRDYLGPPEFKALVERLGIAADTTVILYGDKNNWWAAYAFWVFQLFGHADARLMDGGRLKWRFEGRTLTRDAPDYPATDYPLPVRNDAPIRAFRGDVLEHLSSGHPLVDVRSGEEFRGVRLHMPEYPNEGALRAGHIPGAHNVPWARTIDEDGTFKSAAELRSVYGDECHMSADDDVVVYCRIGERSSHTWFVLTYLLGFRRVRNYDGSWTEWGNLVGVPVERSD